MPNKPLEALAAGRLGRVLPVPNKPPEALAATSLGRVLPVPKSPACTAQESLEWKPSLGV